MLCLRHFLFYVVSCCQCQIVSSFDKLSLDIVVFFVVNLSCREKKKLYSGVTLTVTTNEVCFKPRVRMRRSARGFF